MPAPPPRSLPGAVTALAALGVLAACSTALGSGGAHRSSGATSVDPPTVRATAPTVRTTAPTVPDTSLEGPSPTSEATTVPSTTEPAPVCTVTVEPGDSLSRIASRFGLTLAELVTENEINPRKTIHPGQVFDVCVGNQINDVTGALRLVPPPDAVRRQQEKLNELFAGYSLPPLLVDGISGKYTRQAICAARMGLGLPVHTGHLIAGSEEEAVIFAASELSIPVGAPTDAERWILIDKTCQVIFTGEGDHRIVDVFPTSTGVEGFETRNGRTRAFRFDPAVDNNGWHDSSTFPVAVDNPLNGNMYKPLYFHRGQAIHGANHVPPEPQSKGCARTRPAHQDRILRWLGLDQRTEPLWNEGVINVTVVVQGRYVDPTAR